MSNDQASPGDPLDPWRIFREATIAAWSNVLADQPDGAATTQALSAYIDTYLASTTPFREAVERYLRAALPQISLPSRDDVIDLAQRIVSLELRLDDLDAKTDRILRAVSGSIAPPIQQPDLDARLSTLDARIDRLTQLLEHRQPPESPPPATRR